MSQTLAIIKPDAVGTGKAGKILAHLENAGFSVKSLKLTVLGQPQAGAFYAVHEGRPFYDEFGRVHDIRPRDSDGAGGG